MKKSELASLGSESKEHYPDYRQSLAEGYVRLWRNVMKSSLWEMSEFDFKLFFFCVLEANWEPKKWWDCFSHEDKIIPRGSFISSVEKIAQSMKSHRSRVKRGLQRLAKSQKIIIKATNHYSIISVCNYEFYNSLNSESGQQIGQHPCSNRPASGPQVGQQVGQQVGHNEELKELKEEEEEGGGSSFSESQIETAKHRLTELGKTYSHPKVTSDPDYQRAMLEGLQDDAPDEAVLVQQAAMVWAHYRIKCPHGLKFRSCIDTIVPLLEMDIVQGSLIRTIQDWTGRSNAPLFRILESYNKQLDSENTKPPDPRDEDPFEQAVKKARACLESSFPFDDATIIKRIRQYIQTATDESAKKAIDTARKQLKDSNGSARRSA